MSDQGLVRAKLEIALSKKQVELSQLDVRMKTLEEEVRELINQLDKNKDNK